MRAATVVVLSLLPLLAACRADNHASHDTATDSSNDRAVEPDNVSDPDVPDETDTAEDSGPVCPPTDPACYFGFDLEGECCDERIWSARVPGQLGTPVDPALVRGCPVRTERALEAPFGVFDVVCDDGMGRYRFCVDAWPEWAAESPWGFIAFLAAGAGFETPVPEGCEVPTPSCRFGGLGGECCEDFWIFSRDFEPSADVDALVGLQDHQCPCLTASAARVWETCIAGWPDTSHGMTYFLMCKQSVHIDFPLKWGVSVGPMGPPPQDEPPCNLFQIIEASGVRE